MATCEDTAYYKIYKDYRRRALTTGRVFLLSLEEFTELVSSACYYCGSPPLNHKSGGVRGVMYSGLDRKKHFVGYTRDNCVPCCLTCNRSKNSMPLDEWYTWLERIKEHFCGNTKNYY